MIFLRSSAKVLLHWAAMFITTLLLASFCGGKAAATPIPVHAVVYVDENVGPNGAYYLNGALSGNKGLFKNPIPYEMLNGIPTAELFERDYQIKTGDVLLTESQTDTTPSDLFRFGKGGTDSKGKALAYSLQFYSDTDGYNFPTAEANAKTAVEQDLSVATKDWVVGKDELDPNKILNLKGKWGVAFVAESKREGKGFSRDSTAGSVLPIREGPIGYVFVSDTDTTPEKGPEPSTLLMSMTAFLVLLGYARQRAGRGPAGGSNSLADLVSRVRAPLRRGG